MLKVGLASEAALHTKAAKAEGRERNNLEVADQEI
jgi:hypothetical protein